MQYILYVGRGRFWLTVDNLDIKSSNTTQQPIHEHLESPLPLRTDFRIDLQMTIREFPEKKNHFIAYSICAF